MDFYTGEFATGQAFLEPVPIIERVYVIGVDVLPFFIDFKSYVVAGAFL